MSWFGKASIAVCLVAVSFVTLNSVPAFRNLIVAQQATQQQDEVRVAGATILMDGEVLEQTRKRLEKGEWALKPALRKLIEDADAALKEGPYLSLIHI